MKNQKGRNEKVFDIVLEESLDKYAEQIAQNEPEYQLTPEDEKIIENSKQKIFDTVVGGKTPKKISVKKILVLAAVIVVIMAIALAATTSAFRMFLYETYSELTGTILNIGTERTTSETYNIVNFKHKDEIIIPNWLPNNMKLAKKSDETEKLIFSYNTKENWLTITQKVNSHNVIQNIDTEDNIYEISVMSILNTECNMLEMTSENGKKTYSAYWYSDKTYYYIMTDLPKSSFEKILQNLQYLEE